jgi:hypothetical protein
MGWVSGSHLVAPFMVAESWQGDRQVPGRSRREGVHKVLTYS